MEISDATAFLSYYQNVRARTRRLLPLLPPTQLEWTYRPGKFTLGDQVRHIAAIERYLYAETLLGHSGSYAGCGLDVAAGYEATVAFFDRCHAETLAIVGNLSAAQLQAKVQPLGGPPLAAWKWLRLLPEHEIHHRGQLYMYLTLLGIEAPPIFGLTSEAVIARSWPA